MARLCRAPDMLAPAPSRVRYAPKVANPFYLSPEWKALRSRRMRDPDYAAARKRCKPGERVILDHDVEIKDGGAPLDPANTVWRTFSEHQAKTERRKRERVGLG